MKTLKILAVIWAIALILLFIFSTLLSDKLWVLYLPIHWGMAAGGAIILLIALVHGFRRGFRPVISVLIIGVVGLSLFFTEGFHLGRLSYFQLRKSHYEQLLSDAIQAGDAKSHGVTDAGPPERHAFYWHRGVTDNWSGVVYDPTGEVMKVNQAEGWDDLRDSRWSDAVGLFGGTLYKAERLQGDWYLCWFT